jgi:hypothetical protein
MLNFKKKNNYFKQKLKMTSHSFPPPSKIFKPFENQNDYENNQNVKI